MEKISKAQVKFVRSLQLKKVRDAEGLFVAEGEKCVEELRCGFELVYYIQTAEKQGQEVATLIATPTEIEQMSSLKTPQGVIGVFKKPVGEAVCQSKAGLILVLDGIQDPGNLGTIIRTCDWFGVHEIVCSRDTADCYNPKVVQATMGALARVKVRYVDLVEWLEGIRNQESGIRIYGTLLDGKNMYEVLDRTLGTRANEVHADRRAEAGVARQFSGAVLTNASSLPNAIIMGNEGNGISAEVRKFITDPIYIPTYPNKETSDVVESLNVSIATAIVLAEFRRPSIP
ncbi:MAG: RNA methyltransferase [Paludibacteraceae bacterium]|nr:RNA methyltransferase [Paludibacteraceae bacterium]